ncbi:divalent metal cation transporter [Escherichia coli]|nr:divalent metal cation transporter [Escherichia coli]
MHSSLTQHLHGGSRQQRYSATNWDVAIAMTIAGFVNLAMMGYSCGGVPLFWSYWCADLDEAYLTLQPLLSHAAGKVFGLSLVAAGLSSTVVGDTGGQVVMQGFIRFHIPLWCVVQSYVAIIYCHSDGIRSDTDSGYESGVVKFWYRPALVPLLIFTQ